MFVGKKILVTLLFFGLGVAMLVPQWVGSEVAVSPEGFASCGEERVFNADGVIFVANANRLSQQGQAGGHSLITPNDEFCASMQMFATHMIILDALPAAASVGADMHDVTAEAEALSVKPFQLQTPSKNKHTLFDTILRRVVSPEQTAYVARGALFGVAYCVGAATEDGARYFLRADFQFADINDLDTYITEFCEQASQYNFEFN